MATAEQAGDEIASVLRNVRAIKGDRFCDALMLTFNIMNLAEMAMKRNADDADIEAMSGLAASSCTTAVVLMLPEGAADSELRIQAAEMRQFLTTMHKLRDSITA